MGLFWTGSPTPSSMQPFIVEDRGIEPSQDFWGVWRGGPLACQGIKERVDQLWPMGGNFQGDPADPSGCTDLIASQNYWEADLEWCGSGDYQYAIHGFILDGNGAGIGNAEIILFRTADDVKIRTSYSVDSSGQYEIRTDDNVTQYYLVVYRPGPDLEGTTVNTLTGS